MARYIDADILRKNEIARCHCVPCVGSNDNNYKDLDEVLNDCPTADVVEVVRCRDCKYSRERNENERRYLVEGVLICTSGEAADECWNPVYPSHFCSYGERRE